MGGYQDGKWRDQGGEFEPVQAPGRDEAMGIEPGEATVTLIGPLAIVKRAARMNEAGSNPQRKW